MLHDFHNKLTGVSILLAIALLGCTVGATCTGWKHDRISLDDGSQFSNHYSVFLDQLACPINATEDCQFARRSYDITAERDLVNGGGRSLDLPSDEAEAIFRLAQDSFNKEINRGNTKNTTTLKEFITRNATVSTQSLQILGEDSIILQVEPGTNETLLWTSFYMYSTGTLDGCTNETLNNMTITAAAPYLTQEPRLNNLTVLAGTWAAAGTKISDDKTNGVASLVKGSFDNTIPWIVVTTLIVASSL
ncbi:hypothetical protein JX266_006386 [Neoarthrinium moseri]|uniref:uncharacterized protein n=1 Tax=Neoarthrinium moseri TaxID=1658444 RepID=UPI001FDCEC5A|nr:uncharacterized protein JN550_007109 [Neoarthrinium moseri]KAI1847534.1 hypothetical protein JX266_006386 [Neoarthrinium moseri]KAI1867378.1 hypothetical protein JN550_007109 [Neoarthrinium moseri]